MKRTLTVVAFVLLSAAARPACYGFKWETQSCSYIATITDYKAVLSFAFTNIGEQPVTITSLKTSCGCTTTNSGKKTYEPGESGDITATFIFGDRVGMQHKYITVTTSEPGKDGEPAVKETHLFVHVKIPEPLKLRPRMHFWRQDEERVPKAVQIEINESHNVEITLAGIEGDAVLVELLPPDDNGLSRLVLTPRIFHTTSDVRQEVQQTDNEPDPPSGEMPTLSIITLQAVIEGGRTLSYKIYARVEPPTLSTAKPVDYAEYSPGIDTEQVKSTPIPILPQAPSTGAAILTQREDISQTPSESSVPGNNEASSTPDTP